eukprot:gnl/Spiro4/18153_TR9692_c0_g1_i1.p1 gnl/Spiro4/18153_TR9692_c0_g1~~gnl/Spiro4/18153_TR9692_c0_g1_i1.p1  ORF type:complete len:278 (+),score=64.15 gnl/Spiro4/18153_TR9692_c0_g1_i1:60-836(+)
MSRLPIVVALVLFVALVSAEKLSPQCQTPCTDRCIVCGMYVPAMRQQFEAQGWHMDTEEVLPPSVRTMDPELLVHDEKIQRLGNVYNFLEKDGGPEGQTQTSSIQGGIWLHEFNIDEPSTQPNMRQGLVIFDLVSAAPQHGVFMLLDTICRATVTHHISWIQTTAYGGLPRTVHFPKVARFYESLGFKQEANGMGLMYANVDHVLHIASKNQRTTNVAVFNGLPSMLSLKQTFMAGPNIPRECASNCALPGEVSGCFD